VVERGVDFKVILTNRKRHRRLRLLRLDGSGCQAAWGGPFQGSFPATAAGRHILDLTNGHGWQPEQEVVEIFK
jgi:hypothetical protein